MINAVTPPRLAENLEAAREMSSTAAKAAPREAVGSQADPAAQGARRLETPQSSSVSSHQYPGSLEEAAQEFEALLMGQILRMSRQAGSGGWLGSQDGKAANPTLDFAESQLAKVLAQQGVLGISPLLIGSVAEGSSSGASTEARVAPAETSTSAEAVRR